MINRIGAVGTELNGCEKLEWHNTLFEIEQYITIQQAKWTRFTVDSLYHILDNKYVNIRL